MRKLPGLKKNKNIMSVKANFSANDLWLTNYFAGILPHVFQKMNITLHSKNMRQVYHAIAAEMVQFAKENNQAGMISGFNVQDMSEAIKNNQSIDFSREAEEILRRMSFTSRGTHKTTMRLLIGKMWAKMIALSGGKEFQGDFTGNAVIGVRG